MSRLRLDSAAQLDRLRSMLTATRPPRLTYAYQNDGRDSDPPYALIGRLASLAWLRTVPLQSLID